MSLLLDALRRAGARRDGAAGHSVHDAPAGAPAPPTAAEGVFLSTEGERRHRRRRHALLVSAGLALCGVAVATGWLYWQGLQRDFTRDLARYSIAATAEPRSEASGGSATEPESGGAREPSATGLSGVDADTLVDFAGRAAGEPVPADAAASDPGAPEGRAAPLHAAIEAVFSAEERTVAAPAGAIEEAGEGAVGETTVAAPPGDSPATAASAKATAANRPDTEAVADAAASHEADHGAGQNTADRSEPRPNGVAGRDDRPDPAAGGQTRRALAMVQRVRPQVAPLQARLRSAYDALQAGDLRRAEADYRAVLDERPDNADALLGIATIAHRRSDLATARTHYARVLADQPQQPHALAGLLALDGVTEPRRAEAELQRLLRDHPDAHALHFALGNLYAAEARWGEAQAAYFEAVRGDGRHPDYAYNLAVALDRLGQRAAAYQHYRRALELAEERGGAFAPLQVRERIEQLR